MSDQVISRLEALMLSSQRINNVVTRLREGVNGQIVREYRAGMTLRIDVMSHLTNGVSGALLVNADRAEIWEGVIDLVMELTRAGWDAVIDETPKTRRRNARIWVTLR